MRKENAPLARAIIAASLRITKLDKMRSIYESIAPASDGAVHSFQNPANVETNRLSHSSTWLFAPGSANLATLPKKTALGNPLYRVRDCIVPHTGRVHCAADYSRAEARWCAYMARDEERIALQEDATKDEYKIFAALVMWDDETRAPEVEKKVRDSIGKVGVLSGQYKVGANTLQTSVNDDFDLHGVSISLATARKMEAIWPERFPRTVEYWNEVREQVLTHGFTVNPFGRRRVYFGRDDSDGALNALVREAIADGPQSANAMALCGALARLYEKYDPESPVCEAPLLRVLLNVHDEIKFDCAPANLQRVARIVKQEMEVPFDVEGRRLVIPAEVSATSTSWGAMKRIA